MDKKEETRYYYGETEKLDNLVNGIVSKISECIDYVQDLQAGDYDYTSDQIDFLVNLEDGLDDMGRELSSQSSNILEYFPNKIGKLTDEQKAYINQHKNESKKEEDVKLTDKDKFLTHILNGVISDIQDKFNVTATADFTTGMTDTNTDVTIQVKGDTLNLIDATSYLASAIRRDDVEFEMDDTIKNNTVTCIVRPK